MTDPTAMSDEELRSAVGAWEAGRAQRWAQVALLKGAEHLAARATYMEEKATYERMKAEVARRGLRRRRAERRSDAGPVEQIRCQVNADERLVTAKAAGRARHMDPTAAALKARLQRGLRGLQIPDGEVLRGRFLGPVDDDGTDIENLLLTNIEIPAAPLAGGFAFEHDPRPPQDAGYGYEYEPVDPARPFDLWRAGVEIDSWEPFELKYGLTAPAIWWQARKRRRSDPPNGSGPPGRLMVRTQVTHVAALSLDQIKAATDGVLAAAQWMAQATVANTGKFHARLLAAGIPATQREVVDLLRDPAGATLGPRNSLITRGGLVSPSDHLVVAGIVAIARCGGTAPGLSARVDAATAVTPSFPVDRVLQRRSRSASDSTRGLADRPC